MKSEIVVHVRPQPRSAAVNLLSRQIPQGEPRGSDLLRSIRTALNGSAPDSVASTYAPACFTEVGSDSWVEQELSWNRRCVVLSHGGVIRRKWDFFEEGQSVQYACLGRFAHSTEATGPVHGSAHYTSSNKEEEYAHAQVQAQGPAGDITQFGPFHAASHGDKPRNELAQEVVPAAFVFLRSIGKVFLSNGVDYTFSLPFLVRKAWPLYPHGVLIQRVLEPAEVEEARFTGDTLLPTIFSITNPFAEPAAIGITAGIVGGHDDIPASLSDEDEQCSKPLAALSAAEEVVWVSTHNSDVDVLITFNEEIRQLVVWRYTYVKPKGVFDPIERGRTKASFWVQRLTARSLTNLPDRWMEGFSAALFDQRHDGSELRTLLAICIPGTQALVYALPIDQAGRCPHANHLTAIDATSVVPIRATRAEIWDLLAVKPGGTVSILTHGLYDLPIQLRLSTSCTVQMQDADESSNLEVNNIVAAKWECVSSVTLTCSGGENYRGRFDMLPQDSLVSQALRVLALVLPKQEAFDMHRKFLEAWTPHYLWTSSNAEFHALSLAISFVLELKPVYPFKDGKPPSSFWDKFCHLAANSRSFADDPALQRLKLPVLPTSRQYFFFTLKPSPLLAPVLYALHMLAEDLRLTVQRYDSLLLLVPLVCQIAHITRPEWVDYWKRLCPNIMPAWPSPSTIRADSLDDRIPVWPPDMTAVLYGRLSNPDWKFLPYESPRLASLFDIQPSFAFGNAEPLLTLQRVTTAYLCLAGDSVASTQRRAELTVETLIQTWGTAKKGLLFLDSLPLGIAAPLREAIRTCQLSPPGNWRSEHYELVGRRDLAFSVAKVQPVHFQQGLYQSPETYVNSHHRVTISSLVDQAKSASIGEIDAVSGVELDLNGFSKIRFGQDRRLEEVARMFCSSSVASARLVERPELNEHDQAKEQQHQVVRLAERTLALPYGRAMFTFGTVQTVTREAYVIPKMEFSVRIQPANVIATPEPGKIPQECSNWGEFHNGVAAGLRISPGARGVESSWIAFNKPSELTPQHAGFLFGLGLTGHLKEMLTWHTFGYLTPKHDFTSIGVLLGLSAANVGSGNKHVTKLLAVHTPALLPTPTIDLNVSLMTQAAGLAGVGILYLGTKNRRMAEVCLHQISRKDLVQPDLSNEHREAYTYAAAIALGMIMLGQGSSTPADTACLHRLRVLVHGEVKSLAGTGSRPTFDTNITSPAATMALGLMYLKTGRKDVADILEIPSTIIELNRIQPSFLLMRTIARSLIMWDAIGSTEEWVLTQVPPPIMEAMQEHMVTKKVADDAIQLAYYNILAGCCFVVGLKYAGTARHEAYMMLSHFFDSFSRFVAANGVAFDHKIKRSAVREGLNLVSIALCMVMAGTGEISCLRRLRYAYGMYHQAFRYGVHVATHLSLGLLFLGAGRFTLGTSNAAIACLVTAFFPRFHHVSSDNKSYLQALRHLWVLAVEPRCLVARDVNTCEAAYLPVKITTREGNEKGISQLISPTLIPDFGKLLSVRVDTPRYWPFFVDLEHSPEQKKNLLKNQTLYVKRRTAFLSYTEDPRGSRSLFVRSGSSAGDAATLDFPQLTDAKTHPASDLTHFISSFSNDTLFLAFADYFSRDDGETHAERIFHAYCHAVLLDSILQDKMETLQSHLALYQYRTQPESAAYFHLRLQDLRFAADFYSKVFERRFCGRAEHNPRPPLIRENTVSGALQVLDKRLGELTAQPRFNKVFARYARGETIVDAENFDSPGELSRSLAWYLLRNGVPSASLLVILRQLAREAYTQSVSRPPPEGTADVKGLDVGIKEVLRGTGTKMINAFGSGWSGSSLDRVIDAWQGVS